MTPAEEPGSFAAAAHMSKKLRKQKHNQGTRMIVSPVVTGVEPLPAAHLDESRRAPTGDVPVKARDMPAGTPGAE
jgi:hypothetical protein